MMKNKLLRITLLILEAFIALTAIVSGVLGLTGVMQIPLEWLQNTPFTDYTIPMVMLFIIGISSLVAAATVFIQREWTTFLSIGVGLMMTGFEVVQLAIMQRFSWLQVFYFVIGMAVFGLASYLWMIEYRGRHFQSRHASHA